MGKSGNQPPVFLGPFQLLRLAVWFGLLTGLLELCARVIHRLWLGRVSLHIENPDVAWMCLLTDVLLFTGPGLVLLLAIWCWRRRVSLRTACFLFAIPLFATLILSVVAIERYAVALLALGCAVQSARMLAARPQGFLSCVSRTWGWLLALSICLATGYTIYLHAASYRSPTEVRHPTGANTPNVLFITLDTVRAQNLSLYGYARKTTPNLEQLASRGVCFDRAVAPAPWTLPSHASMFTARFPQELSIQDGKPLDATYPTLAEALAGEGYATAGFVANIENCGRATGLDRGFGHYEDFTFTAGNLLASSSFATFVVNDRRVHQLAHACKLLDPHEDLSYKRATAVNRDFLSWLSHRDGKPFFVFLNYMDAHTPYLPPEPFDRMFGPPRPGNDFFGKKYTNVVDKRQLSPELMQIELDAYDGGIAYLDHEVGVLLEELDQRGLLDHTVVVITADHGEQFGEHGLFTHGQSLYWQLLHVPLVISWPGRVPAGKHVAEPVSLRDLPATILDLAGVGGEVRFPGASLVGCWDSQPRVPDDRPLLNQLASGQGETCDGPGMVFAEAGIWPMSQDWYPTAHESLQSLVLGAQHYIRSESGREELYNLDTDPEEAHDLSRTPEAAAALERFRACLAKVPSGRQQP
jgi:arylsulfatase A-like enzyme